MNKKIILGIVAVIVIAIMVGFGSLLLNNNDKKKASENNSTNNSVANEQKEDDIDIQEDEEKNDDTTNNQKKVLVVYFSATNNTKSVAEKIAKNLNGDTFEIIPEEEYTSADLNYGNPDSRVSKEHDNESLRNVKLKTEMVENWDNYDTILIGYPIWWGVAAWPVDTFVKSNDFNGKTVIPFCTSASSGLGQSGKLLESVANGGNWLESHRFSSRPSDSDIKTFTDGIK